MGRAPKRLVGTHPLRISFELTNQARVNSRMVTADILTAAKQLCQQLIRARQSPSQKCSSDGNPDLRMALDRFQCRIGPIDTGIERDQRGCSLLVFRQSVKQCDNLRCR